MARPSALLLAVLLIVGGGEQWSARAQNSTGFVRLPPYSYKVCARQPGEIVLTAGGAGTSACIPVRELRKAALLRLS